MAEETSHGEALRGEALRGEALREDGTLKDASEMDWVGPLSIAGIQWDKVWMARPRVTPPLNRRQEEGQTERGQVWI